MGAGAADTIVIVLREVAMGQKADFVTARPDVRFAAHNGLKSDIAGGPVRANS
jgi:hypothetical protein